MRFPLFRPLVIGVAACVAALSSLAAAPTFAAVICVPNIGIDGSCTGSAATINAGIGAASAGDTVLVDDGTYVEFVVVDRNVTLVSLNGRAATTIDPPSTPTGTLGTIKVTSGTTGVQIGAPGKGFTVHGIDNLSPGLESAAIYFQGNHSSAKVLDNEIVAAGDAGLQTEYGATVSGLVISGNTFSGQTFTGANPADFGFGNQFTTPNVPRQLVAVGCGGGCLTTSSTTFTNNLVTGAAGGCNSGGQEQGNTLVTIDSNGATITGNDFSGTTSRYATSLRARGASTTISGNTFDSSGLVASCATPIVPIATGHVYVQNTGETVGTVAGQNTFDKGVYANGPVGTIGLSIQSAHNAVAPGTTVSVLPGTYQESPNLTKSLTLQATAATCGATVIQLLAPWPAPPPTATTYLGALTISGADTTIDGFTIVGRDGTPTVIAATNIYLSPGLNTVTITDNCFKVGASDPGSSTGDDGFGIVSSYDDANVNVNSLVVTGNTFQPLNAAADRVFYINPGVDEFRFENNAISGNFRYTTVTQAADGLVKDNVMTGTGAPGSRSGGLAAWGYPDATVWGRTTFTGNDISGTRRGIGIYEANDAVVQCNRFADNERGVEIIEYVASVNFDLSTIDIHTNSFLNSDIEGVTNNCDGVLNVCDSNGDVDAENNWWGCAAGPSNPACDAVSVGVDYTPVSAGPAPCVACTQNADCNDGLVCNGVETCNVGTGMCVPGTAPDCSSFADQCNAGACAEPGGCQASPLPDGTVCVATADTCSVPDTCQTGACTDGGGGDVDIDGICATDDNCPVVPNADQADIDNDDVGNVCDPDDGPMNATSVDLKRSNNVGRPNGGVGLKGDVILDPSQSLIASPKLTFTVTDSKTPTPFSVTQTWTIGVDCVVKGTRITCSTADKKFKARFKPFPKTPDVYRFSARFRKLATATDLVFEGPVTVVLTFGPPPPASGQFDLTSVISDCRATSSGIKCRQF
ncbi:MAG: hypothetical protein IT294_19370 [Deltaproteobacteria bacterium]|nr:hypothetical protein [Deltaproteobacteria bacterium]